MPGAIATRYAWGDRAAEMQGPWWGGNGFKCRDFSGFSFQWGRDWFSKAWDMTVWPPNMVQTWWSTLFETNKDVKIDGKKRHPRLFSGRVLINVPISMLVSKCGFYIGNPRAMFVVFYGFTFCNTLSKIYVSGFASWQIQMNIYVSGFVMYVALSFQHLC